MTKGDRSQGFRRPEASVWTTRLWPASKHYAGARRMSDIAWDWRAGCHKSGPSGSGGGGWCPSQEGLAAYLMCALRGESGSASAGWPYWKEVGYAPPYGIGECLPDTFTRKG